MTKLGVFTPSLLLYTFRKVVVSKMLSYISLDLETTGFSAYSNEIIQIGAYKIIDGVLSDKFITYVKPIQYIPREVQSLTKITPQMVADYPSIDEILPEFFNFCGDLPFLGHNLQFDYNFLLVKGRDVCLDFSLNNKRLGIDTLKLAKKFFPNFPKHSLEYLVEAFNIFVGEPKFHDAGYDAYMTKLVYDRFIYNPATQIGSQIPELLVRDDKSKYGKVEVNDTLSFS